MARGVLTLPAWGLPPVRPPCIKWFENVLIIPLLFRTGCAGSKHAGVKKVAPYGLTWVCGGFVLNDFWLEEERGSFWLKELRGALGGWVRPDSIPEGNRGRFVQRVRTHNPFPPGPPYPNKVPPLLNSLRELRSGRKGSFSWELRSILFPIRARPYLFGSGPGCRG